MSDHTYIDEFDVPPPPKAPAVTDPDQVSLFDVPPRSRRTDPDTSHEAASSMHVTAASHRGEILELLRERGGATGDAIDEALGWKHATANRRLPELREMGLVTMTEDTALTRSGRRARIWRIVERGDT
mgnify:FL=1|jgi:DNA-binding transcriptional ArsR family regulator